MTLNGRMYIPQPNQVRNKQGASRCHTELGVQLPYAHAAFAAEGY